MLGHIWSLSIAFSNSKDQTIPNGLDMKRLTDATVVTIYGTFVKIISYSRSLSKS